MLRIKLAVLMTVASREWLGQDSGAARRPLRVPNSLKMQADGADFIRLSAVDDLELLAELICLKGFKSQSRD